MKVWFMTEGYPVKPVGRRNTKVVELMRGEKVCKKVECPNCNGTQRLPSNGCDDPYYCQCNDGFVWEEV